ncbi:MAG TPA: Holliday junction resolvase RuvX [Gammaproteobacteria bacterium]|nr:Holliday junction resolvase RuvX [Gammaproteobacteria bacterium]
MSVKTYLGFDVGTKRTGVAIANSLIRQASGIEVVTHHKNGSTNWAGFDTIINAHDVDLFIVGLPLDKDGKSQEMTFIAKSFTRKLEKRYHIKTEMIDEYLSSFDAKNQLKYNHYHPNAERGEVDKRSAQLILQTWLNEKRFD